MKTRTVTKLGLTALGIWCVVGVAHAWLRRAYSDAEIVSRAELIVVGKVKPGSIVLVPHETKDQGASREHHAELLIDEVLKGQTSTTSMVVSIHYGLDPVVGGYTSNRFGMLDARSTRTNYPKDVIEIFDTGSSSVSLAPITGDIRTNHVWLLHHVKYTSPGFPTFATIHDSDMIGVVDPEDIQPIGKRDELLRQLR